MDNQITYFNDSNFEYLLPFQMILLRNKFLGNYCLITQLNSVFKFTQRFNVKWQRLNAQEKARFKLNNFQQGT